MKIYGQPTGSTGYDPIDSPIFAYWMPIMRVVNGRVHWDFPFDGGYKIHVSPDKTSLHQVAIQVLPELQRLRVPHKVVINAGSYSSFHLHNQQGKFITIYAGRMFETFTKTVTAIDKTLTLLRQSGVMPGPRPLDRLQDHRTAEQCIGVSDMLTYVISPDFRR